MAKKKTKGKLTVNAIVIEYEGGPEGAKAAIDQAFDLVFGALRGATASPGEPDLPAEASEAPEPESEYCDE